MSAAMSETGETTPCRPLPLPDAASAGFWAAARANRLEIQRCTQCRRWNHAPTMACPACGSFDLAYEPVSGRGSLFSWTVIEHPPAPGFRDLVPLIVGVIQLVEQPHLLMVANVLDTRTQDLKLGLPLEVVFERVTDDCTLPQFRPATEAA
jgi:uncharacterized protein